IGCDLERAPVTQLDPYRYAIGLKRAAQSLGAAVHEGSPVKTIEDASPAVARGERFVLRAPRLIVATNGYTPKPGIAASRLFPAHTAGAVTGPVPPDEGKADPDSILVMSSRQPDRSGRKPPGRRAPVGVGAEHVDHSGPQ